MAIALFVTGAYTRHLQCANACLSFIRMDKAALDARRNRTAGNWICTGLLCAIVSLHALHFCSELGGLSLSLKRCWPRRLLLLG